MKKEEIYKKLRDDILDKTQSETDVISLMSSIASEIYFSFDDFIWVGFYRLVDKDTLKVGPYQGEFGEISIDISEGVCGKCARENEIQIENDVTDKNKCPHYRACSIYTKSEIVIPVLNENFSVKAVMDIDSNLKNRFDEVDLKYLNEISKLL